MIKKYWLKKGNKKRKVKGHTSLFFLQDKFYCLIIYPKTIKY